MKEIIIGDHIVKYFGEGDEKHNVLGDFAAFIETLSIRLVIEKTKQP